MKIICISDLHGFKPFHPIPDGDMLIVAGDLVAHGWVLEIKAFDEWMGSLPHRHKIVIAGNHDWDFQRKPKLVRNVIRNFVYLEDSGIEIEGLKIWGTPWQPEFFNWAFNLPRGPALKQKWDLIPDDTNILISHGPPFEALDLTPRGMRVGCEDLANRIKELPNLRLHAFGHIHHSYGIVERNGIVYVNASICDEGYRPVNPPIVIDL